MRRIRITTLVLIFANAALASMVVFAWNRGQARVTEPARLSVVPLSLPDLGALNSVPVPGVDVGTLRDQALFYTTRTFYKPPAASTELPAPDYEMSGTLRLADGKRIAFARKRSDRSSRTLHVGDVLDEWRVGAIEPDHVVLDREGQTVELRPSSDSGASGLIRSSSGPQIPQSGIRVLGAARMGSPHLPRQPTSINAARLYQPLPAQDK